MPMNNNQKGQSAAARLAKLPVVHSACTKLSVFYTDTKCSHPNLRSLCEGLESSMAALVSPVVVKLEPQMSIANDFACKSLDWLEARFPVLHTPTEQIVATAKNKMHEIQDVVRIAANGSVDCVSWLMDSMQQADQPLMERAITVASMGLDSALIMSEALMDRVLPPTEEDKKEEAARLVEGFEVATPRRRYPMRLVSLTVKLCRRTYHMVMENLSKSSGLIQGLHGSWLTLVYSIQMLPQYVQHQLVSVLFLICQMYNLNCPPSQHPQPERDRSCLNAAETATCRDVIKVETTVGDLVQVYQKVTPTAFRARQPIKTSPFDNGCSVKGCVNR